MEFIEPKKHLIWDWNGTLLNDVQYAVDVMNVLLSKRNMKRLNRERYRSIFGFPVKRYYEKLAFDFETEAFEDVCREFVSSYMADFSSCRLFEGVDDNLNRFKQMGFSQSILSATDQASLNKMTSHFDIDDCFDQIYGIKNKFAESKIQRGRELLATSIHSARDSILIGDTDHDLEVGKGLGVDVLLVSRGHQSFKRLSEVHDFVI